MTPLEVLVAARELISDPNRWATENDAEDAEGLDVDPLSSEAVCWCANGAIRKVSPNIVLAGLARDLLANFAPPIPGESVSSYATIAIVNDGGTHDAVLRLFDVAIARLREPL